MQDGTFGDLETFLETGVAASILMPLALLMFGGLTRSSGRSF
jgi:hypothetical protein